MEDKIDVYFDDNINPRVLIGNLYFEYKKGNEIFSFQFSPDFLSSKYKFLFLDVNLFLHISRQFFPANYKIGFLSDLSPDRWGRTLFQRKETILANQENRPIKHLTELDFLLSVNDETRMGAIRLAKDGIYLSPNQEMNIPPFEFIRDLEYAVEEFEKDESLLTDKWIKQLIGPGSSLGGARPKATIKDVNNELWIAKFPSKHDEIDAGAWEKTAHDLANLCGIRTSETKLVKYSKNGSTLLIKRFDRLGKQRIHFISAMTALGFTDGDGANNGKGYLDILSFIKEHCKYPEEEEKELFKRIVFNMSIGNTDDHFRNHGFIYKNGVMELSPIYDINPNRYATSLSLNIDENSSVISDSTILNASSYFDLSRDEAYKIIKDIKDIVKKNYVSLALKNGISKSNIEYMKEAFNYSFNE